VSTVVTKIGNCLELWTFLGKHAVCIYHCLLSLSPQMFAFPLAGLKWPIKCY